MNTHHCLFGKAPARFLLLLVWNDRWRDKGLGVVDFQGKVSEKP